MNNNTNTTPLAYMEQLTSQLQMIHIDHVAKPMRLIEEEGIDERDITIDCNGFLLFDGQYEDDL